MKAVKAREPSGDEAQAVCDLAMEIRRLAVFADEAGLDDDDVDWAAAIAALGRVRDVLTDAVWEEAPA